MPFNRDKTQVNPPVAASAPAIPASTVAQVNNTGTDVVVYAYGGTVTVVQLTPPGGAAVQVGTVTPFAVLLPNNWSITLTYSVIPTAWIWNGY